MSSNPLVAEREDTTTPLAGTLILEDGEALKEALDSKSWVAGGLAVVSTVADSVAAVSDPLGTLFAMGVGWLLDHVQPFTGWLEELTGDADQVRAHAGTWKNIQAQMEAAAESMNSYVAADLADMSGQMIDQYRGAAGDVAKAIQGAGGWAGAMGTALEVTSFIVQVVHDIVRDAISEVIGSVMSYIVELVCTAGLALPVVLEQISTRVASLMGSVGRNVDNLVKSARNLVSKLGELRTLFQKLGNKLDEFFTGSRADLPRTDTPKGDTPPTKSDGTTADGTVDGTTSPKGHEPDPNNPGYDNDGKPLRQDRGDGKPHYANDPPGTYRDKNGKLHDSKGGFASDPYSDGEFAPTGEPNSRGYDDQGNRLRYANDRPPYAKEQVENVWANSRNQQIAEIRNGDLNLPEPGSDEMWVRTKDDATGPDLHEVDGQKWRKIEWKPGEPREGLWDMGHMPGKEYKKLREEYLSGQIPEEEFLRRYQEPKNYQVEDPGRNRSRVDEEKGDTG